MACAVSLSLWELQVPAEEQCLFPKSCEAFIIKGWYRGKVVANTSGERRRGRREEGERTPYGSHWCMSTPAS